MCWLIENEFALDPFGMVQMEWLHEVSLDRADYQYSKLLRKQLLIAFDESDDIQLDGSSANVVERGDKPVRPTSFIHSPVDSTPDIWFMQRH